MIFDDLPITTQESDRLGRGDFLNQISALICNYSDINTNCLVIGIEGDWGSGKTSILNLISEKINKRGNIANVGVFNSWLNINNKSLLLEFMYSLLNCTRDVGDFNEGEQYVQILLNEGLAYVKKILQNSNPSISVEIMGVGVEFNPNLKKMLSSTLSKQKERVIKTMTERLGNKKIVFFIDDIDRLNDDDITLVMQIVKNIADFPNVIYVLAYDRLVVEKALDNCNKGNGSKFLEKIVQVPITLPYIRENEVRSIFMEMLEKIFNEFDTEVDAEHIQAIYDMGLSYYVTNLRQSKRVINAFFIRWLVSRDFCDAGDMLGLITLQIFEPDVYSYMLYNKYKFYDSLVEDVGNHDKKNKEITLQNILERTQGNSSAVLHIIKSMFPKFGDNINLPKDEKTVKRIALESNFYYYFTLRLSSDDILYNDVKKVFYDADEKKFIESLKQWNMQGKIINVWDKLITVIVNSNRTEMKNRCNMVFHGLSAIGGMARTGLQRTPFDVCKAVLHVMYESNSGKLFFSKDREMEIYFLFRDENNSLDLLKVLMDWIGSGFSIGKDDDDSIEVGEKYADDEVHNRCSQIYMERLLKGFDTRIIFNTEYFESLLGYLSLVNKEELKIKLTNLRDICDLFAVLKYTFRVYAQNSMSKIRIQLWLWNLIPKSQYSEWCIDYIKSSNEFSENVMNAVFYLARANNVHNVFTDDNCAIESAARMYYNELINKSSCN